MHRAPNDSSDDDVRAPALEEDGLSGKSARPDAVGLRDEADPRGSCTLRMIVIFLSPWPAILLSAVFCRIAGAPDRLIAFHLETSLIATGLSVVIGRRAPIRAGLPVGDGVALIAAVMLILLRLLDFDHAVARWIDLGPLHLYVAPILVPLVILGLCAPDAPNGTVSCGAATLRGARAWITIALTLFALWLSPDAPQMTAFAAALLFRFRAAAAVDRIPRAVGALALCAAVFAAWHRPDPLPPVAHVEGVFRLAEETSPILLAGTILAAALALLPFRIAARRPVLRPFVAVGLYLAVLFALSARQLTPVPLTGFGAGPVIGHFLALCLLARAASQAPRA